MIRVACAHTRSAGGRATVTTPRLPVQPAGPAGGAAVGEDMGVLVGAKPVGVRVSTDTKALFAAIISFWFGNRAVSKYMGKAK